MSWPSLQQISPLPRPAVRRSTRIHIPFDCRGMNGAALAAWEGRVDVFVAFGCSMLEGVNEGDSALNVFLLELVKDLSEYWYFICQSS